MVLEMGTLKRQNYPQLNLKGVFLRDDNLQTNIYFAAMNKFATADIRVAHVSELVWVVNEVSAFVNRFKTIALCDTGLRVNVPQNDEEHLKI